MSRQEDRNDELLIAVGAGDHQALTILYGHVAGIVYANILRALHDGSRADTVTEEAFFEVWRRASRFDPSRTPAVIWILDLAHQLAAEHNRYDDARAAARPQGPGGGPQEPDDGPKEPGDGRRTTSASV
ncbi:sigma factor [Nitriliruptor alkaliphilus]|uniref:sigma factor n=1 Tax=Nitriliruptor alkaliphilus TaxID=427918 RepID=UPI0006982435|nr:sigma factor [Nitriliruptor alkaliphilus]